MNIDFNAAFNAGMSEADIKDMMERALQSAIEERKAQEEQRLKEEEMKAAAQKASNDKEALKAEGRAYLINAVLAYSEAFDLLPEDETWDEDDIKELEAALIKIEGMVPMYLQLLKMQEDFDKRFGIGDIDISGLFH